MSVKSEVNTTLLIGINLNLACVIIPLWDLCEPQYYHNIYIYQRISVNVVMAA
jgi:hypothetical protein